MSRKAALLDDDDHIDGITATEDDLNDPELMRELAELTGGGGPSPLSKPAAALRGSGKAQKSGKKSPPPPAFSHDASFHGNTANEDMLGDDDDLSDPDLLAELASLTGQPVAAAASPKSSTSQPKIPAALTQLPPPPKPLPQAPTAAATPQQAAARKLPALSMEEKLKLKDAALLEAYIKEDMKQLLVLRQQGRDTELKAGMVKVSSLKSALAQLKAGGSPTSASTKGSPAVSTLSETDAAFERLLVRLREQVSMCNQYAERCHATGDRTEQTLRREAQRCQSDLDALLSVKAHGTALPLFHYEDRAFSVPNISVDLQPNDFEVSVVRVVGLPLIPQIRPEALETFVAIEFPAGGGGNSVESDSTSKGLSPHYDYSHKFAIERTIPGRRIFERKKVGVRIAYRSGVFLFKKTIPIASCTLDISGLLAQAEVSGIFPMLDGDGRHPLPGAKIEVRMRVRTPMNAVKGEPGNVNSTERWLVIDKYPHAGAAPSKKQPAPAPGGSGAPASAPSPGVASPGGKKAGAPASASGPTAAAQQNATPPDDWDSVSHMVADSVLSKERERLEGIIAQCKAKRSAPPSDVEDRLDQVKFQMEMLESQITSGILSMNGYRDAIDKAIQTEKKRALDLKRGGFIEEAKTVLRNVRLMQGELEAIPQE